MQNRKRKYIILMSMLAVVISMGGCQMIGSQEESEIVLSTPTITVASVATPAPVDEASEEPIETIEATPEATPKPADLEPGEIGHIFINNTKVDYPIMIATDNDYFINKDENGKRNNGRGSIFADFRNTDIDLRRNFILYGHNRKDRTMFTTLHQFRDKAFFQNNPYIDITFLGEQQQYEIVYAGIIDYREHYHIQTNFKSEEEFVDFFTKGALLAENVREGYYPVEGDEMLTLSTCVAHSLKDADYKRMVVVARKVRKTDDPVPHIYPKADDGIVVQESQAPPGEATDTE